MSLSLKNKLDIPLWSIVLIPLWWILGVDFAIFHLCSAYIILCNPKYLYPKDHIHLFLLFLGLILIFSLIFGLILFGVDLYRLIASVNNLSILFCGYTYYGYFQLRCTKDTSYLDDLFRAGSIVFISYASISIVLVTVFKDVRVLQINTVFGAITPDLPGLLGNYQVARFIFQDWFGGEQAPRFYLFSSFATGSAIIGVLTGYMTFLHLKPRSLFLRSAILILMLYCVSLTLARAAIAGVLIGFFILIALKLKGRWLPLFLIIVPTATIFLGIALPDMITTVNAMREGSSSTRFLSYINSFKAVIDSNPITGFGIKPLSSNENVNLGTHSTFISFFVRSGIIGFTIALIAFFLIPVKTAVELTKKILLHQGYSKYAKELFSVHICIYISILFFLVFEDIDAYPSICILVMVNLSSFSLLNRTTLTGSHRLKDSQINS